MKSFTSLVKSTGVSFFILAGRRLTAAMAANKYPTLSRHFEDKL